MRIIAYYNLLDANVIRRVVGPLSVLSQRGKNTYYSHVGSPIGIESGNAQLIILPNWVWDGELPRIAGEYCYDLSDTELLSDEKVISLIEQCSYVMVPTKTLATLVKPYCPRILVQPSTVKGHQPWLRPHCS